MRTSVLIIPLLLLGHSLLAREIATDTPVTVTGKLSMANGLIYISTEDTLSGRGNGVELHSVPAHHVVVAPNIPAPNGLSPARNAELKSQAAAGKTVTLTGQFHALAYKGAEFYHCKAWLELTE